ncbi:MAG: hypothetical protein NVSMB21_06380 [Vulcanimicrobiaceae bacterium]
MNEAAAAYELERSVDALYAVFTAYPVGEIAFCTTCHTGLGRLVDALHGADRRRIARVAVAEFFEDIYASAFAELATFKALVPRALELAKPGLDEIEHLSVSTLGRAFALARWRAWPRVERDAVDAWAHAWFEATLACADAHETVLDDVLCALGYLYDDVAPFLTRLYAEPRVAVRTASAHLVLSVCFALAYARSELRPDWSCVGAGWCKGSRPERQMLTWLATHGSYARLIADATTGGCTCAWVRALSATDVEVALATFARELATTTLR